MTRATWNGAALAETDRPVYPHPSPLDRKIRNHVAFWNGVQVDTGSALERTGGRADRCQRTTT